MSDDYFDRPPRQRSHEQRLQPPRPVRPGRDAGRGPDANGQHGQRPQPRVPEYRVEDLDGDGYGPGPDERPLRATGHGQRGGGPNNWPPTANLPDVDRPGSAQRPVGPRLERGAYQLPPLECPPEPLDPGPGYAPEPEYRSWRGAHPMTAPADDPGWEREPWQEATWHGGPPEASSEYEPVIASPPGASAPLDDGFGEAVHAGSQRTGPDYAEPDDAESVVADPDADDVTSPGEQDRSLELPANAQQQGWLAEPPRTTDDTQPDPAQAPPPGPQSPGWLTPQQRYHLLMHTVKLFEGEWKLKAIQSSKTNNDIIACLTPRHSTMDLREAMRRRRLLTIHLDPFGNTKIREPKRRGLLRALTWWFGSD